MPIRNSGITVYFHMNNTSTSEYKIHTGQKYLIVCFGGLALQFGGILPFEFLNYLSAMYRETCDLHFFIDRHQCWYHKGITDLTTNIPETVAYLNELVEKGTYEKVVFMGVSAGGYAAILFGSLCARVDHVIGFIPQTRLSSPVDPEYSNLRGIIKPTTQYLLYGDTSIQDVRDNHHMHHCENIEAFDNVQVIRGNTCHIAKLRDSGFIQSTLDQILFPEGRAK